MDADCTIEPNAEIAGVGIRTSIYAQAIFSFILAALALCRFALEAEIAAVNPEAQKLQDVDPTKDEIELLLKSDVPMRQIIKRLQRRYLHDPEEDNRDLRQARMSVQLTGVALLISALVQSKLYGLDVYHALVVLNLCWLNNITAVTLYLTDLFLRRPRDHFLRHPLPPRLWTLEGLRAAGPFLPTSAYLCALGSYGLWLFVKVPRFGNDDAPECNPGVLYWILGHSISVAARGFRIMGIIIHAVACTPIFNVIIESFIMCWGAIYAEVAVFWPYRVYQRATGRKLSVERHVLTPQYRHVHFLRTLCALACIYVFFVICFILDSEEMIGVNAGRIAKNEEQQWTFGQTLVMILLLPVIWDIFNKSKEMYLLYKEKKQEDGTLERAVLRLREEKEKKERENARKSDGGNGNSRRNDPTDGGQRGHMTRAETVA